MNHDISVDTNIYIGKYIVCIRKLIDGIIVQFTLL